MNADQLEEAAKRFDKWLFMDFAFPNVGLPLIPSELVLIRGERLQRFVDDLVAHRPIESLPRQLVVTATDLQSGKTMLFTHGNAGLAVRASSSVTVYLHHQKLVDDSMSTATSVVRSLCWQLVRWELTSSSQWMRLIRPIMPM